MKLNSHYIKGFLASISVLVVLLLSWFLFSLFNVEGFGLEVGIYRVAIIMIVGSVLTLAAYPFLMLLIAKKTENKGGDWHNFALGFRAPAFLYVAAIMIFIGLVFVSALFPVIAELFK